MHHLASKAARPRVATILHLLSEPPTM
jgi:hypothetical protein